ncbi:MAG TPA: kelch repeat-containing protein [Acidimicrobiales bacterium]|nr:kelch repeat-containing protein [Acidimicrobiales bacterium]
MVCTTFIGLGAVPAVYADTAAPVCSRPGVDDRCEAWVATHVSPSSPADSGRPYDSALSPDGDSYFVTGEWDTVGYSANGDELWVAPFPFGPNHMNPPTGYSVAVSPDSQRVYVTGQYQFPGDPYSATIAYDATTGAQLWIALAGLPGRTGAGTLVTVSPDGGTVFVAGENNGSCFDPTEPCGGFTSTIAYDSATGAQSWVAYDAGNEVPYDLALSADGSSLYVTGNLGDVVAYDASTGAEQWTAKLPGDSPGDALRSLAVSPDSSLVFVTGQTCQDDGSTPCNRYVAGAFHAGDGSTAWVARTPAGSAFRVAWALAVSPTGDRVFVVGEMDATTALGQDFDGVLMAYDASSGAELWEQTYAGAAGAEWTDVAVSPDTGHVLVTGTAQQGGISAGRDFATAAYRTSDGNRAWIAVYNGAPAGDGISVPVGGLAVSGTGRVFVSGTFTGTHSHIVPSGPASVQEWGVVAYDLGTVPPSAWRTEGPTVVARMAATATRLGDGRVLFAGGCVTANASDPCLLHTPIAELYQPDTGTWLPTGPLTGARAGHSATVLDDGQVLVVGGCVVPTDLVACPGTPSAEMYLPALGVFVPTGPLSAGRVAHSATLLADGRVLVAGGRNGSNPIASAEIYDPISGLFAPAGALATPRSDHTASSLPNGRVLVAGGRGPGGAPLASAEVFDPVSRTFAATGPMAVARFGHTGTSLADGTVVVAGGGTDGLATATAAVERYDPLAAAFASAGALARPRYSHTATLLPGGSLLVTGGSGTSGAVRSAELHDPGTQTSVYTDPMRTPRAGTVFNAVGHVAALLADGRVLVAGGSTSASTEVYTPPADMAVVMASSPTPARIGRPLAYTVTAANMGPAGASGVRVEVTLPVSAALVSVRTDRGSCSAAGRIVTCSAGTLARGSEVTIRVVVRPTRLGSVTGLAEVAADEHDPDPADNRASATAVVVT